MKADGKIDLDSLTRATAQPLSHLLLAATPSGSDEKVPQNLLMRAMVLPTSTAVVLPGNPSDKESEPTARATATIAGWPAAKTATVLMICVGRSQYRLA